MRMQWVHVRQYETNIPLMSFRSISDTGIPRVGDILDGEGWGAAADMLRDWGDAKVVEILADPRTIFTRYKWRVESVVWHDQGSIELFLTQLA